MVESSEAGHPRTATPNGWRLSLLGSWRLSLHGQPVDIGVNGQRLLALLALRGPCNRPYLAGMLWPERSEPQAQANLRATLSRLRHRPPARTVMTSGAGIALRPEVGVDVGDLVDVAYRVLDGHLPSVWPILCRLRAEDLLVGWYEDWITAERERIRQLRLHALERLSTQLLQRGDHPAAVDAALAAVAIEPLRESAHRAVIRVHLAEGNRAEALRQAERLRQLLRHELGVEPSQLISELF
jgi:DNA-binding SARP family transcriptional activator